jgi:hypothetical protein
MQVQINDKTFTFPSSLSEFTLGQRIDFQEQYGNELDEMLKSIIEMPEGIDKDLEVAWRLLSSHLRNVSEHSASLPVSILKC